MQDYLTKSDEPRLRTRGHFRTLCPYDWWARLGAPMNQSAETEEEELAVYIAPRILD